MRGIEYSLISSSTTLPLEAIEEQQLSNLSQTLSTRIEEKIEQIRCYSPFHSKIESDTREVIDISPLPNLRQGWLFLYFSRIDMFLNDTVSNFTAARKQETEASVVQRFKQCIRNLTSYERLQFAFKCSFCLGLAVLLGLTFDKENGCWAGLTIAISFVEGRQAIFTIANYRVQGTALGSVYGVICCFLFHYEELRLIALLPWVVFTSFLRHSRMYGQTGGVSAAIGALVILGRKNYGPPNEFAISRLTEVFIGLSAFIVVELFLQPTRAATLAKNQAYLTLRHLQDCIKETRIHKNQKTQEFSDLKEKQRNLSYLVSQLKEFVGDAEMEPSFWFLPFNASCYKNLVQSMSNVVDMLCFVSHNLELLSKLAETDLGSKLQEQINNELQILQETLSSAHIYQEEDITTESQPAIEEEMEAGKLRSGGKSVVQTVEHTEIVTDSDDEADGDDKNLRERMIQCLSATRFCISSVMRELENINFCMREIVIIEN